MLERGGAQIHNCMSTCCISARSGAPFSLFVNLAIFRLPSRATASHVVKAPAIGRKQTVEKKEKKRQDLKATYAHDTASVILRAVATGFRR